MKLVTAALWRSPHRAGRRIRSTRRPVHLARRHRQPPAPWPGSRPRTPRPWRGWRATPATEPSWLRAGRSSRPPTASPSRSSAPTASTASGRTRPTPHGEVRRHTTLASYRSPAPAWDVVLDIDKLAKDEGRNWFWKGATCLKPDQTRCLVRLSNGGGDAVELREFDTVSKTFVEGGSARPRASRTPNGSTATPWSPGANGPRARSPPRATPTWSRSSSVRARRPRSSAARNPTSGPTPACCAARAARPKAC